MTRLTAKPNQVEFIDAFVESDENGGILGLGTGVGKTFIGTEIARLRGAERVLIMGPQSTFDSWYNTVYWQTGKKLRRAANDGLKFNAVLDPTQRDESTPVRLTAAECKQSLADVKAGADGWFFVTRELFRAHGWKRTPLERADGSPIIDPKTKKQKVASRQTFCWDNKKKSPFDIVILDENQLFAKANGKGEQVFKLLKAKFKVVSSADWFGSDIENMYTVATDVFGDKPLGLTRPQFIDDYLETEYDHHAYNKQKVTGEQIPGLFAAELPLYVTAPPSVKPPEPEDRYVSLSKEERALYTQLEKNYVAMVEDEILAIEIPLELRIRLRELSLGMFKVIKTGEIREDGTEKTTIEYEPGTKSSKIEEIKSIMADYPNEKFAMFTHSAKFAEKVAADIPGGAAWTGKRSKDEKAQIKEDFINGDLRYFVATAETMGTGTDGLQHVCRNVIVISPSDQTIVNGQGVSRIARQGQGRQVNLWNIVARDTFDEGVLIKNGQKVKVNSAAKGW